jgi:hypothetical protein
MKSMSGIEPICLWPNGPTSPGRCPGLRNDAPLVRKHFFRPNGPVSFSPAHRAGSASMIDGRPNGSRSVFAWFRVQPYRAPLARGIPTDGYLGRCPSNPGRCPRLRDDAPLAQKHFLWPNGPTSLSPAQRAGWESIIDGRPNGSRYQFAWFRVQPYRAPLARGIPTDGYLGRCPRLRNDAPLVRKITHLKPLKNKGPQRFPCSHDAG